MTHTPEHISTITITNVSAKVSRFLNESLSYKCGNLVAQSQWNLKIVMGFYLTFYHILNQTNVQLMQKQNQ